MCRNGSNLGAHGYMGQPAEEILEWRFRMPVPVALQIRRGECTIE
jgi:hypothetical protein